MGKHSSDVWNLLPLCLMWFVGRECTWHTFEDLDSSRTQLLATFSRTFHWSSVWGFTEKNFFFLMSNVKDYSCTQGV